MYLDSAYGGPAPSPRRDHHAMRADLSDIIERALLALDALSDDPDLELSGDDEPSLGAPEADVGTLSQIGWARGSSGDCEEGDDNGIGDDGGLCEQFRGEEGRS